MMTAEEVRVNVELFGLLIRRKQNPFSCMLILVKLYKSDEELFYNLALAGVGGCSPALVWMRELETLARRLQKINRGFDVVGEGDCGRIRIYSVGDGGDTITFDGVSVDEVKSMCAELRTGRESVNPTKDKRGRMVGTPVSKAYVEYRLRDE